MCYCNRVVQKLNPLAAGAWWEQRHFDSVSVVSSYSHMTCQPATATESRCFFYVTAQHEANSNTTRRAEPLTRPCSFALPGRQSDGTRPDRPVGATQWDDHPYIHCTPTPQVEDCGNRSGDRHGLRSQTDQVVASVAERADVETAERPGQSDSTSLAGHAQAIQQAGGGIKRNPGWLHTLQSFVIRPMRAYCVPASPPLQ
jgi:hypothetical protein